MAPMWSYSFPSPVINEQERLWISYSTIGVFLALSLALFGSIICVCCRGRCKECEKLGDYCDGCYRKLDHRQRRRIDRRRPENRDRRRSSSGSGYRRRHKAGSPRDRRQDDHDRERRRKSPQKGRAPAFDYRYPFSPPEPTGPQLAQLQPPILVHEMKESKHGPYLRLDAVEAGGVAKSYRRGPYLKLPEPMKKVPNNESYRTLYGLKNDCFESSQAKGGPNRKVASPAAVVQGESSPVSTIKKGGAYASTITKSALQIGDEYHTLQ